MSIAFWRKGRNTRVRNNEVLFATIVKEYDAFNKTTAWYDSIWFVIGLGLLMTLGVYVLTRVYVKSKMSDRFMNTMEQMRNEFHQIKVD